MSDQLEPLVRGSLIIVAAPTALAWLNAYPVLDVAAVGVLAWTGALVASKALRDHSLALLTALLVCVALPWVVASLGVP